ncbi:MAG: RelA/SpoT family protein [Patescibacteria group bacterium]
MAEPRELIALSGAKMLSTDRALLEKAFYFAERAHKDQKRLSGEPYFTHAFATAKIIAWLRMDAKTIAAGLLHDVLEDTPVTEEELKREFGPDIVFLVKGVTKLGTLKYRGHERHVESLRKFFVAMANDLRVVIIKFADRLHNLQTLEHVPAEKRERIALESLEVYAPLANRLGMGKLRGLIEDAAFPYAYPEEYEVVNNLIKEKKEPYEKYLAEVRHTLEKELRKNRVKVVEISTRIKHKYSLWKKLEKYGGDLEKIYDIIALRVVTENISDCYRILGIIHSIWKPLPGRIKDYIAVPKPNGYRSIHTTIFTGSGGIAEIQIRTLEMHAEAAYGIAAHFSYKEKGAARDKKSKFEWIEELKNLKGALEEPKKFLEHLRMDFFSDRIFIFTPKGDVLDLPEHSTPIDFAYSIHSEIGDHTAGAKINGKMSPILSKLKNGDIVEIIYRENSHPSSKWLDASKTTVAKKHIRAYLEKNSIFGKYRFGGS